MAVADKKSGAKHKVYTIVGDGCLMEGISYEAGSLAGHLSLDNLIILFDDNQITIDGPTNLTVSEDHIKKFQALGWETQSITQSINGHDFDEIRSALAKAQSSTKPHFIACRTSAWSSNKSGSESSHGSPLGAKEIAGLKDCLEWSNEAFFIPEDLLQMWRSSSRSSSLLGQCHHEDRQLERSTSWVHYLTQALLNEYNNKVIIPLEWAPHAYHRVKFLRSYLGITII